MIERRKLFVAGGAALTYLTALGAGHAQPTFADVAGDWEGSTTSNVKLNLSISADGQYALMFLSGPAGGSMPRGRATWKDDVVIMKYGDTEINLTKSADGKLAGPYKTSRSKGVVTFTRK
jgi:hypothetical protein